MLAICCAPLCAHSIQPPDAGLQPLKAELQRTQNEINSLATNFSVHIESPVKRKALGQRIVQLLTSRKRLETEIEFAEELGNSPWVNFISPARVVR